MRGGGNATRQIIDILPPAAEADRLLVCEVLTPAGNWSSYPPHKHDRHNPPVEADLEETYYYRFSEPGGYGIQRLYTSEDRDEQVLRVTHGDLVLVREGYHPFVASPGVDAYYLNTLAGSFRSMAATDDPRYAHLRASWPPPDPRVPMIAKPSRVTSSTPKFQLPIPRESVRSNPAENVFEPAICEDFNPIVRTLSLGVGAGRWEPPEIALQHHGKALLKYAPATATSTSATSTNRAAATIRSKSRSRSAACAAPTSMCCTTPFATTRQ